MASTLKVNEIQHTGGTAGMTIDSAGRVFRPVIPAWNVSLNSNQTHSSNSSFVVNWDKTSGNSNFIQGGCTISSGAITVPVAGLYQVSANIRFNNVSANYIELYLRIGASTSPPAMYAIEGNPYEPYHTVVVSGVLKLNANNTLDTLVYGGGDTSHQVSSGNLSTFSGVMIG